MAKVNNTEPLEITTSNEEPLKVVAKKEPVQEKNSEVEKLKKEMEEMRELLMAVSDQNKIRTYETGKKKQGLYKFSLSLYPVEIGDKIIDKVIVKWDDMLHNLVAEKGNRVKQVVRIHLEDGQKVDIDLQDFARVRKRTEKIRAKKMVNMDGSPVAFRDIVLENDSTTQIMQTNESSNGLFIATIPYNGKDYEICSIFLNA